MPSKLIFVSYSRSNSAFALRLANDLQEQGTPVWIDQRNIDAGVRWDAEIEKALKAADTVLLILSPEAVASNNVMDELSFAIDEHKRIIPVLMAPCEVPFRIRRLQHIDCYNDYENGLQRLKASLKTGGGGGTIGPGGDGPTEEHGPRARAMPMRSSRSGLKYALIAAGAILLGIIAYLFWKEWNENRKQQESIRLMGLFNDQIRQGDYNAAISTANEWVSMVPEGSQGTALSSRGIALVQRGLRQRNDADVRNGIADFRMAEAYGYKSPGNEYVSAQGNHYLKNYTEVIQDVNELQALLAGQPEAQGAPYGYGGYNLRGMAYLSRMDKDKACADFSAGARAGDSSAAANHRTFCIDNLGTGRRIKDLLQNSKVQPKVILTPPSELFRRKD